MARKTHCQYITLDAAVGDQGKQDVSVDGVDYEVAWRPKRRREIRKDASVSFRPNLVCPLCGK